MNNVSNVQSGSGFKKNNSKNPKDNKNRACFHCGKKGHYIRKCKLLKNKKKDEEGNTIETNVIEEIVAMVSGIHFNMITEVHMTVIANPFDLWFDLGATVHVCNNKERFRTYDESSIEQQVLMGNHNKAKVLRKGTVKVKMSFGKMLILTNVFHVPDIKKNLVSANLLCKNGVKAILELEKLILPKNGIYVGKGYSTDGMHKLSIINKEVSSYVYFDDSSYLWHARLGHLNFKYLKFMSNHGMILYKHDDEKKCEICIQAKMTKKPFSKSDRNSIMLELVHSDVCELNGVLTRGGERYFIKFIDDFSRFTYVYLMRNKDESFDMFKHYKIEVENQNDRKIKIRRSDRGGEYFPNDFSTFCEEHGIIHQSSALYTPLQNGLAERKNRTLVDMVNVMILSVELPFNLGGEALLTACHVHNRVPSKKIKVSLYEL